MNRVVHFEMSVDDPNRAVDFYEKVFGWKSNKWEGPEAYWLITTGADDEPGINGGFMKRREDMPQTFNTIGVESVDESLEKVTANGGTVVMPKFAIPGVGYQAYCKDTEGNIFGIHQMDTAAK